MSDLEITGGNSMSHHDIENPPIVSSGAAEELPETSSTLSNAETLSGLMNKSDAYKKLGQLYSKAMNGARSPERQFSLEKADVFLGHVEVGERYRITTRKEDKKPDKEDKRKSVAYDKTEVVEGMLLGFSFPASNKSMLSLVVEDKEGDIHQFCFEPSGFVSTTSRFDYDVVGSDIVFFVSGLERLRLEHLKTAR